MNRENDHDIAVEVSDAVVVPRPHKLVEREHALLGRVPTELCIELQHLRLADHSLFRRIQVRREKTLDLFTTHHIQGVLVPKEAIVSHEVLHLLLEDERDEDAIVLVAVEVSAAADIVNRLLVEKINHRLVVQVKGQEVGYGQDEPLVRREQRHPVHDAALLAHHGIIAIRRHEQLEHADIVPESELLSTLCHHILRLRQIRNLKGHRSSVQQVDIDGEPLVMLRVTTRHLQPQGFHESHPETALRFADPPSCIR